MAAGYELKVTKAQGQRVMDQAVRTDSGCWEYRKNVGRAGYGLVCISRGGVEHNHNASRVAYAHAHGYVPKGMVVRHRCDNKVCVNPDHLELGTSKQNTQDAIQRGQYKVGEEHQNAKLTTAEVIAIRSEYAKGGVSQRQLAKKYNVTQANVWFIVNGRARRYEIN